VFLPIFFELFLLVISVFLIYNKRGNLYHSNLLKYILTIFGISLLLVYSVGYDFGKPIQQVFSVSIFLLLYEQFFRYSALCLGSLFKKYIKAVYYVCMVGGIQEIIFVLTGVNVMDLTGGYYANHIILGGLLRVTSTLSEGGWLGTALMPSLIYLFYFKDKLHILGGRRWVVFAISLLTMSPFVYLFYCVLLVIIMKNHIPYAKRLIGIAAFCFIGFVTYSIVSDRDDRSSEERNHVIMRIQDTYQVMTNIDADDLATVLRYSGNASTSVIATNMYIGLHAPSRLFGTGIGTNAQSYDRIDVKTSFVYNADDGYSLFNRILSEFGWTGLFLYILFVYRYFNRKNAFNICFLCMILSLFCRGGNYMLYGTMFVHFFYYYTSKFEFKIR